MCAASSTVAAGVPSEVNARLSYMQADEGRRNFYLTDFFRRLPHLFFRDLNGLILFFSDD